jgi:heat shock protein HtpX
MAIGKRVVLFLLTNILILVSVSVVLSVLGVQPYLTAKGLDYQQLAAFCLIWGFGGAFISLGLSRIMAKWMMRVKVIDPNSRDVDERWLLDTVGRLANQASLPKLPQVGVYESDDVNAFATGPTKSRALVAVSSGLLRRMNRTEVEGVLAHEVAHVANGDMVTMTLIQGVINAFVMFFARIVAWSLSQFVDEEKRGIVHFIAVILFEIVFSMLGMIVVSAFSRHREYRADRGGANLVGKDKMLGALQSLQRGLQTNMAKPQSIATMQISGAKRRGVLALISTHPPLEQRIERLKAA